MRYMRFFGRWVLVPVLVAVAPAASAAPPAATGADRIWTEGPAAAGDDRPLTRDTFTKLAAQAGPAVVNIFTTEEVRRRGLPLIPFTPLIPGLSYSAGNRTHLGTGFIIHPDGYILTNRHVIGDAREISVHLLDGRTFQATRITAFITRLDVVLLKIDADEPLPVLPFGDSDHLRVGQWVVAIGNAFGLRHTVTTGTVSNIIRAPGVEASGGGTYVLEVIQTDASINPGNSGGPLLDLNGNVVGMNTAVLAGGENVGFALAIDPLKEQLPTQRQLAVRPMVSLGAQYALLSAGEAEARYANRALAGRLQVVAVDRGSPAARGRLRPKDVIISIDGKPVMTLLDMRAVLSGVEPGAEMTWVVRRGKRDVTLTIAGGPVDDR